MSKTNFVFVPNGEGTKWKSSYIGENVQVTDLYYNSVTFIEETKEIATHGVLFGGDVESGCLTVNVDTEGTSVSLPYDGFDLSASTNNGYICIPEVTSKEEITEWLSKPNKHIKIHFNDSAKLSLNETDYNGRSADIDSITCACLHNVDYTSTDLYTAAEGNYFAFNIKNATDVVSNFNGYVNVVNSDDSYQFVLNIFKTLCLSYIEDTNVVENISDDNFNSILNYIRSGHYNAELSTYSTSEATPEIYVVHGNILVNSNDQPIGVKFELYKDNKLYSITLDLSTENKVNTSCVIKEFEQISNKVSLIDENSTYTQYASAKAVYDYVQNSGGSTKIKFAVSNKLEHCTFSNNATEAEYGTEYTNVITVDKPYEMESIVILMGGIDITSDCWDADTKTISISSVNGNISISGIVKNGYTITYTLPNAQSSNTDTSVLEGDSYTTDITVNEGYNLDSVVVTMGGSDITSLVYSDGTIKIPQVTGDVVITAVTSLITFTVTQGTVDGVTCDAPATVGYNLDVEIKLTLLDGYEIREDKIVITEGGVSKSFTYSDNKITIKNVKGNIIYNIDCAATYTVTYTFNNVTSSNTDATVTDQDIYTTTLSYDTTLFTGIEISVTMGGNDITNSVYTEDTHTITIDKPTGNIVIHAEAIDVIKKNIESKIDLTSLDWKFNKLRDVATSTFDSKMLAKSYDDSSWSTISVPHDWSSFNSFNTSTTGNEYESGWLAGGDAIYRTTVTIPSDYSGNKIYIHFDGIYMESEVYVNGTSVGTNKNGYIPFTFDITDQITVGEENTIAVAVTNHVPSSRWYSGSGIYRDAWISMNNVEPVGEAAVVVTTPNLATENGGTVTTNVQLQLENITSSDITLTEVTAEVYQEWDSVKVGSQTLTNQTLSASATSSIDIEVGVSKPTLWTTFDNSDNIRLYKAVVVFKYTYNSQDYQVTTNEYIFGYRYISWDSDGFYLNGTKTFLKGMCNHHDNGPIGSQTNYSASERKLRILKEMGCNTLRCTHNPESREFLECAMRMGFMVIEELFDGWRYSKNSNTYDYARFFNSDDSYIKVVVDNTIKRDINNPAIIMWSLGNEVQEGTSQSIGTQYVTDATTINTYVKALDTTRATTTGNNLPNNTYAMQIMALVDIAGINYGDDSEYKTLRSATSGSTSFANKCIYGSETVSPFYTRGIYETSTTNGYLDCFDYSNSEESNSHASWGDSSCVSLKRHTETYTWLAGTCPWTGFDYIGEPTPVNSSSVRSSFFGVVDMCGLKKDAYYMYQAKWTTTPMIHIVPEDWTIWTEGSSITVWVYSNCDSVKLHLNGTEISSTATPSTGSHYAYEYSVTYAKGTLVATGYDSSNNIVAQDIRYSCNTATKAALCADKTQVAKDGSLLYIDCQIQDKYGTVSPRATTKLTFSCEGGTILATDNGYPCCFEDLRNTTQSCFTGHCVVIVKPDGISDNVMISGVVSDNSLTVESVSVPQGDTNIYVVETTEFVDPTNPPIHSSVTSIELSETSVSMDNSGSSTVTVTKTPSTSTDQIEIVSVSDGFTATVDNTTNIITIINTKDDTSGVVVIDCGGIQKTINVASGSAALATCTMKINGTEYSDTNKTIYVWEYLPVTFTVTGSTVSEVTVSSGQTCVSYDSSNSVIFGKSAGAAVIAVTLANGNVFDFDIVSEEWTNSSSNTLTTSGIDSCSSNYYLPTITSYTTSTSLSGGIVIKASDTTLTTFIAIIDLPVSTTLNTSSSGSVLAEFGTDSTGLRKAYVIKMTGTAGGDISFTLAMTDSENGRHRINIRSANTAKFYEYKIGTLSCTSVIFDKTEINITSDEENQAVITATILPADTTDDIEWSTTNNYVAVANGQLYAIKNGTDTVTCTCGDQSATCTVNISNITEDSTILLYNSNIDGSRQYYGMTSSGISWDSTYTLFAELKVTDMSVSTQNVISFGSSISSWGGNHYHIYYPATTQSTSYGNFDDLTTKGICIAMGTSSGGLGTYGVTTTMKGGQELDTIYLVQNANGLWINGTEATSITKSSGSFATIQKLSTVQIGSEEGSTGFSGIVKQLRVIKTTDLNSTYSSTGLTSTELETISNDGFDPSKYLAIYEASNANLSGGDDSDETDTKSALPVQLSDLESLSTGDSIQVLLANPQKSNGYIFGYTTQTAGYSNSTLSTDSASGFSDQATMTAQVNSVLNSDTYSSSFVFTLTKISDTTYTISLINGYGPTGETADLTWSTTLIEYTISDLTSIALSSTSSLCDSYSESYCMRLVNPSGYYLNAQGTPASAKFATSTNEWSVWYIYKVK